MAQSNDENRQSNRATVILMAALERGGISIPVKVSNVSATGALLIGEGFPDAGAQVVFRRKDLAIRSRVAWVDRDHAGIEFQSSLEVEALLRDIPQMKRTVQQLDFRRPGLRSPR